MFSSTLTQIAFTQFTSIQIPDKILKNWKITNWLSLKKSHIIFRAVHRQTEEIRIFQIISKHSFSKPLWEALFCIRSDYLLLPDSQRNIKNGYLLSYAPAIPLDNIIQKDGMDIKMILQLLLDISKALQKLHQADILHMDVSPRNIYLSEYGHFMLGDFSESIQSKSMPTQKYHQTTSGYAAPEYSKGKPVAASDQYSLAMLAYVLLNDGFLPKDLHSLPEPSIIRSDPKFGQDVFSVIRKALSSESGLRYENISVFRETIQTLLSAISGTSNYYLHITDKSHSFFQLSTEQNINSPPPKAKGKFFMIPAFLLFLIFIFFSGIHLQDKTKQKEIFPTETALVQTDSKPPTETSPANIETNCTDELDFADRNLSSLVEVMAECENPSLARIIYVENNHLKSVEELEFFSSLQELYLSNNQIQNTNGFQELTNLSVLILSDNLCTDLQGLSSLQQLNFLDLSGNRELSDISPLANCQNLNTLVLSDTAVMESSIKQLQAKLPECEILY